LQNNNTNNTKYFTQEWLHHIRTNQFRLLHCNHNVWSHQTVEF